MLKRSNSYIKTIKIKQKSQNTLKICSDTVHSLNSYPKQLALMNLYSPRVYGSRKLHKPSTPILLVLRYISTPASKLNS